VVRATGPTEYEILDPKDNPRDDKSYQMRLILVNGELLADVLSKNGGELLLRLHSIFAFASRATGCAWRGSAGNGFGTRSLGPAARATPMTAVM